MYINTLFFLSYLIPSPLVDLGEAVHDNEDDDQKMNHRTSHAQLAHRSQVLYEYAQAQNARYDHRPVKVYF